MVDTHSPSVTITSNEIAERYGDMFNHLIEGIQIIDFDHRYLYVNDAAVKQNKFTREQLVGRTQMEMYPGIEKTAVFATIHECVETGASQYIENEFKFPDGSSGWYEVRSEPIPYGVLILSMDISARKRADELAKKETIEATLATERAEQAEMMNKLVYDRELKMIALKEKIAQLEETIRGLQALKTA